MTDITSYFSDYVKSEVMEALVEKLGYSKEKSRRGTFYWWFENIFYNKC